MSKDESEYWNDKLQNVSSADMINYLSLVLNEDVYYNDFLESDELFEALNLMAYYKLVFSASDGRLFLTEIGNLLLQNLLAKCVENVKKY
jgi:hypothetical protein